MLDFEGVIPALGVALKKRGYEKLTPVQEAVLAPELVDRDLLVSAQTGSGKTVAFGLTLAPNLLEGAEFLSRAGAPLALVVAPTRELALQVQRELQWLFESTRAVITSCVGGMDMRTERRALSQGAHIVVGTPGRLRDHIDRGALKLETIKTVILDEADEMLDLGFREDLEYILETTPETRRTLMFSATVPRQISSLAKRYQNNAFRLSTAAEEKQHNDIEYRSLLVSHRDVENGIINALRYYDAKNTLVFCATRAAVSRMTSRFSNRGFSVVALSGELSQEQRSHALQAMRDGRARVCVATDVAARGIDLPDLELVIHADLPNNKETLLHRSGRTGRAGRKGTCLLMVPANLRGRADRLLRGANVQAEWAKPPSADEILARDDERILTDATLQGDIQENEAEFIAKVLAQYSPEQVAAAFIRGHRASRSAPEELMEVSAQGGGRDRDRNDRGGRDRDRGERGGRDRGDRGGERDFGGGGEGGPRKTAEFEDSKWISISVGRNQKAEPRWLLPMICKASNLTKRSIGSIKIRNDETFIEIAKDSFDGFIDAVGPNATLEKSIRVTQVDGMPDFDREQPRRDRGKPEDGERRDRPERGPRRERGEHPVRGKRGDHRERYGAPGGEKKWDKPKLSQEERKGAGEDTRSRGPKREDDRPSPKQENRKNRDKALGELSDKSANADKPKAEKPKRDYSESKPAGSEQFADESNFIKADETKKSKKPKKSKTVKFTGLKKKGDGEKSGGAAPRRRPS
jgi:ATP-dependent RNA helicase DeaD